MLGRNKRDFLGLTQRDPLFPVKFAHLLLDRAFQNFVLDLGDFHNKEDPMRRARRALKGQQVRDMDAAMSGFKTGSLSQLFLPRTSQTESSNKGDDPTHWEQVRRSAERRRDRKRKGRAQRVVVEKPKPSC